LIKTFTSAALAASLLLTGCGGGADTADQAVDAQAMSALSTAGAQHTDGAARRHALAGGAFSAELAGQLFALAESSYAAYFPSKQTTRSFEGWAYRYYPETGIYLAVIGSGVYVLGGSFGPEVIRLGEVTDYVVQPPTGSGQPLTASVLGQCPDSAGSQSPGFYQCMVGSLTGTQKFNTAKSCRLEVSDSGVWTLASDGKTVSVGPSYGFAYYSKAGSSGILITTVTQPGGGFTARIELMAASLSFTNGGTLDAEAKESGSSTATISCRLNVPK
jgi:hypothetical protein